MQNQEIKVGDIVRSFDFAVNGDGDYGRDLVGEKACYIEGRVEEIGPHPKSTCDTYRISVHKDVFSGFEQTEPHPMQCRVGLFVFAPVNGVLIAGGNRVTNTVERILGPV